MITLMSKKSDVGYFSDSRLRALSITAIALTDIQTIPINTFTAGILFREDLFSGGGPVWSHSSLVV